MTNIVINYINYIFLIFLFLVVCYSFFFIYIFYLIIYFISKNFIFISYFSFYYKNFKFFSINFFSYFINFIIIYKKLFLFVFGIFFLPVWIFLKYRLSKLFIVILNDLINTFMINCTSAFLSLLFLSFLIYLLVDIYIADYKSFYKEICNCSLHSTFINYFVHVVWG